MKKFAALDENGNGIEHDYQNRYFRQPCGESWRLVIGPSSSHIKVLDQLATKFFCRQYFVLYVPLLSHAGRSPGRYQSPLISNYEDLQLFIWTFQNFFEGDGRHNIWISSADSSNILVYDQHNVIYAYGNIDKFESVLIASGFMEEEFQIPVPHVHSYEPSNLKYEDELMEYFG